MYLTIITGGTRNFFKVGCKKFIIFKLNIKIQKLSYNKHKFDHKKFNYIP
jgi:hypothetical protein